MSASASIHCWVDCGSTNNLSRGKLVPLPPRIGPSMLSYHSRVDFLKLNLYPGLSLLSSLERSSGKLKLQSEPRAPPPKFQQPCALVVRCDHPQNADLPRYYSKKEKKPFPVPIVELRRAARERFKKSRGQPKKPVPPPKTGLTVKSLVPIAYDVLNARVTLINNLKKLMKVVKVHACGYCNEIHVGPVGHPFKSCRGQHASIRKGLHEWTYATVDDVFLSVDAYHLYDRLGKRIRHDERFSIPRIPAVVELCIQAGVDIPAFPTKRRRKPIIRIGKKEFVDADESELPDPVPEVPLKPILTEIPDSEIVAPRDEEETIVLAEETLQAWEQMRRGAKKLMRMYCVRVCGYCACGSLWAQSTELWSSQAPATKWATWLASGSAG
ncbi:hypothetical protein CRYUN_Cryun02cG0057500 [Craigia yunnanensis]